MDMHSARDFLIFFIALSYSNIQIYAHYLYANETWSEAVVSLNAASTQQSVARVDDDVTDDVTGAAAQQQGDPQCQQKIPR